MRKVCKQSGTLALYKLYSPASGLFTYLSHDINSALYLPSHVCGQYGHAGWVIGAKIIFLYLFLFGLNQTKINIKKNDFGPYGLGVGFTYSLLPIVTVRVDPFPTTV